MEKLCIFKKNHAKKDSSMEQLIHVMTDHNKKYRME